MFNFLQEKFFGSVLLSAFLPKIEPYVSDMCFLPKPLNELAKNPWSKDLDVIIGGCADEGLLFYYELPTDAQLLKMEHENELFLPPDLRTQLTTTEAKRRGTILKKLYFGDEKISLDNASKFVDVSIKILQIIDKIPTNFFQYLAEKHFWHGIYLTIINRIKSNGKGKTYLYRLRVPPSKDTPDFYEFTRNFSNIPHRDGTCHSEDIPLLFKAKFTKRFKGNDDNYLASQRFLGAFVEFVNSGDPNHFLVKKEIERWNPLQTSNIESIKCFDMGQHVWQESKLANIDKIRVWETLYDKNLTKAKY